MLTVRFRSNLDYVKGYLNRLNDAWPEAFPGQIPAVGTQIEFTFDKWEREKSFKASFYLDVVAVRFNPTAETLVERRPGVVSVELHAPRIHGSVAEWEEYFRRHVLGK